MNTNHHADGPDSLVLSGPPPGRPPESFRTAALAAFFANDNTAPRSLSRPAGAISAVLCQEHAPDGQRILTIRLEMAEGEWPLLHSAGEADEIIALWRAAGRDLNLPLTLRDADGRMSSFTQAPGATSFTRRGGSPLSGRRPRVMRRRQPPLKGFALKKKQKA